MNAKLVIEVVKMTVVRCKACGYLFGMDETKVTWRKVSRVTWVRCPNCRREFKFDALIPL